MFLEKELMETEVTIGKCKEDPRECGPFTYSVRAHIRTSACNLRENGTLVCVRRNNDDRRRWRICTYMPQSCSRPEARVPLGSTSPQHRLLQTLRRRSRLGSKEGRPV